MKFVATAISGVQRVELEPHVDERGFFARAWCREEGGQAGIHPEIAQVNISYNRVAGTVRGLHFQMPPAEEEKMVRCIAGRLFDVVVDLRHESATFGQHVAVELSAENRLALVIPRGCAHGFQTLSDDTEVLYFMSEIYRPECAAGLRFDDPALGIAWPLRPQEISDKDTRWPGLAAFRQESSTP